MHEVYRREEKYLMTLVQMERFSGLLSQIMAQDSHNGAQGYRVRSLYFDTIHEGDYEDKLDGVEIRRKIRLRIYDVSSSFALLEMKEKKGSFQKKRSLRLERQDAQQLNQGEYKVLLDYTNPFAQECYAVMHSACYLPKTIVEYKRKAFVAKENNIRITFDGEIQATETRLELFNPKLNMCPVLHPLNSVLEVKYNGYLLSYIKNLVNTVNQSPLSVSKYCLARKATMKYDF